MSQLIATFWVLYTECLMNVQALVIQVRLGPSTLAIKLFNNIP